MKVIQSCPTLCDPIDYTVHGILQGRILEWVAFPFSRGSSRPRDQTQVSQHCRWILYQLSHQGSPRLLEWVACPFQGNLTNPGIEPGSAASQADSLPAEPQEKPKNTRVAYPFASRSSQPRNRTRVCCIAGGFFTTWAIRQV